MLAEALTRWVHFLAVVALFATVAMQHLLLKGEQTRASLTRATIIDAVYGAAAVVAVCAGLVLWFGVGKPSGYYNANWIFHAKVGLVVLVATLSIAPTLFLLRQRKYNPSAVAVPRYVIHLIRTQLLLLVIIVLLATLMANGYGSISR